MGKLIASVTGLVAIVAGAARWLFLLPWAGVQQHNLQGLANVGQEHLWGILGGSGLVCVGVLLTLRALLSSRGAARRGAKKRSLLFWGLAGGGTVTIHALVVAIHFLRP